MQRKDSVSVLYPVSRHLVIYRDKDKKNGLGWELEFPGKTFG